MVIASFNVLIKCVDLRWNNSGLIGGRAFVDCLKWNTTLIELDLTGNELPEDIAIAIGMTGSYGIFKIFSDVQNRRCD